MARNQRAGAGWEEVMRRAAALNGDDAVKLLAHELCLTRESIERWKRRGHVPAKAVRAIERLEELRSARMAPGEETFDRRARERVVLEIYRELRQLRRRVEHSSAIFLEALGALEERVRDECGTFAGDAAPPAGFEGKRPEGNGPQ